MPRRERCGLGSRKRIRLGKEKSEGPLWDQARVSWRSAPSNYGQSDLSTCSLLVEPLPKNEEN